MYDAYFEQRGLIPEGRLCEVGYEDLERDPVGVVGSVYESLGLPGFEDLRPRLEGYLGSIAGYRKNRSTTCPSPCGAASPTSGAGASTSGGTSADGTARSADHDRIGSLRAIRA